MTWINKEELIERAYEEEKYMSEPYHDTLGVTVEWLADKTTKYDESKYAWHDLRKNPDDLPNDNDEYTWYECVHENHEDELCRPYYQFTDGEFGYWEDKYHPITLGFVDSEFKTIDDMGYERIIAWRYIDEFQGARERDTNV